MSKYRGSKSPGITPGLLLFLIIIDCVNKVMQHFSFMWGWKMSIYGVIAIENEGIEVYYFLSGIIVIAEKVIQRNMEVLSDLLQRSKIWFALSTFVSVVANRIDAERLGGFGLG